MDLCEKHLEDAREALKDSLLSKRDPMAALQSLESAAQCFENAGKFERGAQCYLETARKIYQKDALKAAEMLEKVAVCIERGGNPSNEYYLQAATIFGELAVKGCKGSPGMVLQLLQKAAENFEKGGDRKAAIGCYELGANASLERKDYLNALIFYGIMSQSFTKSKEYEKAIEYYQKIANLWELQGVPENVAENYCRVAECYDALKEYQCSSQFLIRAGEKYEETKKTSESARSYEKAGERLEMQEEFQKAAESYSKAAELTKSFKNREKVEELYEKTIECYGRMGEAYRIIEICMMLADVFSDDPYRCIKYFKKAVSCAEYDPRLKAALLGKLGETMGQIHDFWEMAECLKEIAEIFGELGKSPLEYYKKAGDAYVLFAKEMMRIKNQSKWREGFENAALCFEKAGAQEEMERISHLMNSQTGEREEQIRGELDRLAEDVENGLLAKECYMQMKEGYQELLRRLEGSLF